MQHFIVLAFILFHSGFGIAQEHTRSAGMIADDQQPGGRVIRYGIFSMVRGGEIVSSTKTTTGMAMSNLVMTFIRQTEQIPIKKDRLLAYQYRLTNLPVKGHVKLTRVLVHPPFTLPDGSITTGSEYTINKKVERNEVFSYDVYGLNESYEMVEGDWLFQIWYEGKKLVEQKFTTYWPNDESVN